MNGEYKVFCRYCSVSVYNTEATLDHEGKWKCNLHKEDPQHSARNKTPLSTVFIPRIVRKPAEYTFGNAPDAYWETEIRNWEDIDVNWEDM